MPIRFVSEVVKGLFGISETTDSDEAETSITVERETDDEGEAEKKADADETDSDSGEAAADETDSGEAAADESEAAAEDSEDDAGPGANVPVGEITGIGPTYSERLADIGIETVADLSGADASEVAEAAQVSESRASDWLAQAEDW